MDMVKGEMSLLWKRYLSRIGLWKLSQDVCSCSMTGILEWERMEGITGSVVIGKSSYFL